MRWLCMNDNKLIERLNQEKESRKMSNRQFAELLDMSHAHLSNVLNGDSKVTWKFAARVAEKLNLNPIEAFVMAGLVLADEVPKNGNF